MKLKSMTPRCTGNPPMAPETVTIASLSPALACARFTRAG